MTGADVQALVEHAARQACEQAIEDLRAADATHLATAVTMGAHRFITNNSRDFGIPIKEIAVTFTADLSASGG